MYLLNRLHSLRARAAALAAGVLAAPQMLVVDGAPPGAPVS
jgi:hypothetical protein